MSKEYSQDLQRLFLEMMIQDAQSYVRVQNIYNPENFDRSLRDTAEFIKEHTDKHKIMPTIEQIKAVTGAELKHVPNLDTNHYDWFLGEFEGFTKKHELERAILKAADMLEKGDFNPVEKLIKDAVQISLTKDMGTDYFADPKQRIEKYYNSGGQVSTGWQQLDKLLYGGFSRGELNIFAGGSGSGKSLVMMNIALSWLQAGLSGVYISLELSEELCALRTDAMLTGMGTKEIRKDIDTTTMKVRLVSKKAGNYQIKGMPAQSNVNDIRAYLKEYQIQCMKSRSSTGVGQKIDLDYDIETMRITDSGADDSDGFVGASRNVKNVLDNIKPTASVDKETGEISVAPKINAEVGSSKLKSMLSALKNNSE